MSIYATVSAIQPITATATLVNSVVGGDSYTGFQDFNDTSTEVTPLSLTPGVWVDVPNNGAGAFTNTAYFKGDEVLVDTSTGALDISGLELGDSIIIRNDIRITTSVNGAFVEFRYKLGAGAGTYYLTNLTQPLTDGAREYALLWNSMVYAGDVNSRDNPVQLQVRCSTTAEFRNLGCAILLYRK